MVVELTKEEKTLKPILKLENVSFKYRENLKNVLENVNFSVEKGEYIVIIGHNGSGKSTLSKILIGILKPQQGVIKIFDNILDKKTSLVLNSKIGIVFQNPDNQFIGSTVQDDIAFGLENKNIPSEDMPGIIQKYAKLVGMENFLDHEPMMLSGGQKQRVAIASALALEPEIIIFDESTSMLDPKGKEEVKTIILQLKKERTKTILFITHDMDEIINADKVLILSEGKIVDFCEPQKLIDKIAFLKKIHLDVPFILKVSEGLKAKGLNINNTFNEKELIQQLCDLKK